MRTVAAKRAAREIPAAFPDDLKPLPCPYCGRPIVWAKGNGRLHGTRPVSVELAAAGDVALERELFNGTPDGALFAYETNLPTRYRWHGPHCSGPSFVAQAPARKVRS